MKKVKYIEQYNNMQFAVYWVLDGYTVKCRSFQQQCFHGEKEVFFFFTMWNQKSYKETTKKTKKKKPVCPGIHPQINTYTQLI